MMINKFAGVALILSISAFSFAHDRVRVEGSWKLLSSNQYAPHEDIGHDFLKEKHGQVFTFSNGGFSVPSISNSLKCKMRIKPIGPQQRTTELNKLGKRCGFDVVQEDVYVIEFQSCPNGLSEVDKPFPKFVVQPSSKALIAFEDGAVLCLERN